MNRYYWLIIVILIFIGGIFFFRQKKPEMKKASISELATSTKVSSPTKEFTMIVKQWVFDQAIITVKQGDKVRIKIKSIDVTHGFALPDFNVKVDLVPNKEETVEFVASKKGEFTFFCSVQCGEGHQNMKGKLIVE